MSITTLVFEQILGTALLLILIMAVTDDINMHVEPMLYPLYIGLGLTAIINAFSYNGGGALNPARDFAP